MEYCALASPVMANVPWAFSPVSVMDGVKITCAPGAWLVRGAQAVKLKPLELLELELDEELLEEELLEEELEELLDELELDELLLVELELDDELELDVLVLLVLFLGPQAVRLKVPIMQDRRRTREVLGGVIRMTIGILYKERLMGYIKMAAIMAEEAQALYK